jgi:hypothetical protein
MEKKYLAESLVPSDLHVTAQNDVFVTVAAAKASNPSNNNAHTETIQLKSVDIHLVYLRYANKTVLRLSGFKKKNL